MIASVVRQKFVSVSAGVRFRRRLPPVGSGEVQLAVLSRTDREGGCVVVQYQRGLVRGWLVTHQAVVPRQSRKWNGR